MRLPQQQGSNLVRRKTFRGGWSTSISDLFGDPSRHSDFCALTCCGILLSDRNAYLLDNANRPNWRLRRRLNFILPMLLLFGIIVVNTMIAMSATTNSYQEQQPSTSLLIALLVLQLLFWGCIIFLLMRGANQRAKLRRAALRRMYERNNVTFDERILYLGSDVGAAAGCCNCYQNDIMCELVAEDENLEGQRATATEPPTPDLCTSLWRVFSSICCGSCCRCWLQLCGMCAVGQEDREIQRMILADNDRKALQIDYISFQPFSEYYQQILVLRNSMETRFAAHWKALSKLSQQIMWWFGVFMLIKTIYFVLTFEIMSFLIFLAVYGHALLILYLVYWRWYRLDISLDAVIKYFASGYILSTFMAVVFELVLVNIFAPILWILVSIQVSEEYTPQQLTNPKEFAHEFIKHHLGEFAIFAFLLAFVIAALVEEICKYFSFWMVETPDLMKSDELILEENSDSTAPSARQQSLVSQGSKITIAMVVVATGFACSENLQYVLQSGRVMDQVIVFLARSLLPVHPVCAAIQSVGLCRRDLEGDRKSQLGRIILPAVILHGAFDFVAMFWGLIEAAESDDNDVATEAPESMDPLQPTQPPPVDAKQLALTMALVGPVFLAGLAYYWWVASRQRRRLAELDSNEAIREMILIDETDSKS